MSTDYWAVDYLQLNASINHKGDSAIVLLVKKPKPKPLSSLSGVIYSAVLIDAGNGPAVANLILKTIAQIKSQYTFPTGVTEFKFDAVVISHWDDDHFKGFNFEKGLLTIASCWENQRFKYFNYATDGTPQTRLYCQDWSIAKEKPSRGVLEATNPDPANNFSDKTPFMVRCNVKEAITSSSPDPKNPKKNITTYAKVLEVFSHPDNHIGMNLFTGNMLNTVTRDAIKSPADLINYNDPWTKTTKDDWKNAPGLYIAGSTRIFLGETTKAPRVIDHVTKALGDTNSRSLIEILVWKDESTLVPRVSLYSGGDSEYEMENKAVTWLNGLTVTAVKVGHHGSKGSMSTDFIDKAKPDRIVISAGTEHAHPTPELIMYLDSLFANAKGASTLVPGKRVHAICYPYHLGYVKTGETTARFFRSVIGDMSLFTNNPSATTPPSDDYDRFQTFKQKVRDLYPPSVVAAGTDYFGRMTSVYNRRVAPIKEKLKTAEDALQKYQESDDYTVVGKKPYVTKIEALKKDLENAGQQVICRFISDMWGRISDTGMEFYPTIVWKKASLDSSGLKLMDFLQLTFVADAKEDAALNYFSDAVPAVAAKPPPTKKTTSKKKKKKGSKNVSESDPASQGVRSRDNAVRTDGTSEDPRNKRNRETDDSPQTIFKFVMTSEEEEMLQRLERGTDGEDAVMEDDVNNNESTTITALDDSPPRTRGITTITSFSRIVPFDALLTSDALLLTENSNADWFVRNLLDNSLSFSTQTMSYDGNGGWSGELDDPLVAWFETFLSAPSNDDSDVQPYSIVTISMNGSLEQDPFINKIAIIVETTTSKGALTMAFSSAKIVSGFNVKSSSVYDFVDNQGLLNDNCGLLLGLDPDTTPTTLSLSLPEIFRLVGLDLPVFIDTGTVFTVSQGDGAINGLWFYPSESYGTVLRLTAVPDDNSSSGFLTTAIPGIDFGGITVIARKTAWLQQSVNGDKTTLEVLSQGEVCIKSVIKINNAYNTGSLDTAVYLDIKSSELNITLTWDETCPIDTFIAWMKKKLDIESGFVDSETARQQMKCPFVIRQANLSVSYDSVKKDWNFNLCSVVFEADLKWGIDSLSGGNEVPMQLILSYNKLGHAALVSFSGGIWPHFPQSILDLNNLNPYGSLVPFLKPNSQTPQYGFSLLNFPGVDPKQTGSLPNMVPTWINSLKFDINTESISFSADLIVNPYETASTSTPWLVLESVSVQAEYELSKNSNSSLQFGFEAIVVLQSRYELGSVATLDTSIDYIDGSWKIAGDVTNLTAANLYPLFPSSDNDGAMDVLEEIIISTFHIEYDTSKEGSTFTANGVIFIGEVELDLNFWVNGANTPSTWAFEATLSDGFSADNIMIGDFLAGISQKIPPLLPPIISNTAFNVSGDASITLKCERIIAPGSSPPAYYILFSLAVDVMIDGSSVEFSFAQIVQTALPANAPPPVRKRLLKFTLDALPSISAFPILDKLDQPFDEMYFLWTSDSLTVEEVDVLNSKIFTHKNDQILYTNPSSQAANPKTLNSNPAQSVVIQGGSHFVIVAEENNTPTLILDYNFGSGESRASGSGNGAVVPATGISPRNDGGSSVPPAVTSTPPNDGSAQNNWTKKIGPLSISAIGLKLDGYYLQLTLDAAVDIGGVSGKLRGFGVRMAISNLRHFDIHNIQILLDGIELELVRPPVELAGGLVHRGQGWYGGITIAVEPYTFAAAGFYGNIGDYKSIFVFVEMDGPLVELEAASLSGVTGGFGYNSQMTLPTVQNVTQFPFLTAGVSKDDPLATLDSLINAPVPWFTPAKGPKWLAAGLDISAVGMLNMKTVMVLDLTDTVIFGLFADCTATIPAGVTNDAELFALVDIGVIAILDPARGTFRAEGQLTPRSFIFSRNCHLTGGFAVCYWFKGSGHEGDWVVTVGGYHAAYQPPAHYPTPVRLGISWQYDDNVSINGQAYFAITPKVCMGGGCLKLAYRNGNLDAHLDAWADLLINYKPFYFMAQIGISIGIKYTLKVAFITKHFDLNLGAVLDLKGPPLAGHLHVNWSVLTVDVYFGTADSKPDKLTWSQFCDLLRQTQSGTPAEIAADNVTGQHMHRITASTGLVSPPPPVGTGPLPSTGHVTTAATTDPVWLVDGATFSFGLATLFPLTKVLYGTTEPAASQYTTEKTYMKPMRITSTANVTSQATITVQPDDTDVPTPVFGVDLIKKQVPSALWGAYDTAADPMNGPATSLLSPAGATKEQVMGVQLTPSLPTDSQDLLEADALASRSQLDVFTRLPGPKNIPESYFDSNNAQHFYYNSSGQPLSNAVDNAIIKWRPAGTTVTDAIKLTQWKTQSLQAANIVSSWMFYQGAAADSSTGAKLTAFGQTAAPPLQMISEYGTSGLPMPLITADGP